MEIAVLIMFTVIMFLFISQKPKQKKHTKCTYLWKHLKTEHSAHELYGKSTQLNNLKTNRLVQNYVPYIYVILHKADLVPLQLSYLSVYCLTAGARIIKKPFKITLLLFVSFSFM